MLSVVKVASYIYNRYQQEFGCVIDEMKLHKLLYFTQREAIIQTGQPLFNERFSAWKYGPVMVCIRDSYKHGTLNSDMTSDEEAEFKPIFDSVFAHYAGKDSWSLSILSHGELSWKNARQGYGEDEPCDVLLKTDDIRKDAERIKLRRILYAS